MRQRGQLLIYSWLAAAAVMLVMGIAIKVESSRLESCKTEHAAFQASVKAQGEVAIAKTKAEIERQAKLLKESEVNSAKAKSDLSVANKRLRDERARSSRVPAAPAGSAKPDLACFGRADLERALQQLDEGVSGLADEGDQNTLRLKMSREWASVALKR